MRRLLLAQDLGHLRPSNVVLEVYAKRLDPDIEVLWGEVNGESARDFFDESRITPEFDEVLQEYPEQVRNDVPAFLLGALSPYLCRLPLEIAYFISFQLHYLLRLLCPQDDCLLGPASVLTVESAFPKHLLKNYQTLMLFC